VLPGPSFSSSKCFSMDYPPILLLKPQSVYVPPWMLSLSSRISTKQDD
jgi:hypothetical protein